MEQKPCPRCGYVENVSVKAINNFMNTYVDKKTGDVIGVINSDAAEITTKKGQVMVRKDLFKPAVAPAPKAPEPVKK